jgi:hypothetical protein
MSKKSISLDQCLSDEILDASQKMGIARKKRMIFINLFKPIVVFRIIDVVNYSKCKKINRATGKARHRKAYK